MDRILFLLLLAVGWAACSDVSGPAAGPVILTRGPISVTVLPELGGRVASVTLNGEEVLRTERDEADLTWGSTAWTSPQSDWNWPPPATFDSEPFEVTRLEEHNVVLTSAVDPATRLQMTKRIRLGPDNDIGLTYYLTNQGDSAILVAPWEITRLPYGGRIEFSADSVRTLKVELEGENGDYVVHFDDRYPPEEKIFADIREDPVTYYRNGLLLRKFTAVTELGRVPEGEAPLEIYLDSERGFVEFELVGEYMRLEHGQPATLRTRWQILGD